MFVVALSDDGDINSGRIDGGWGDNDDNDDDGDIDEWLEWYLLLLSLIIDNNDDDNFVVDGVGVVAVVDDVTEVVWQDVETILVCCCYSNFG